MIAALGSNGSFAIYLAMGMAATVNPCGFAMLPAYLAYFLGIDDGTDEVTPVTVNLARALRVAVAVSAGFLAVFAVAGTVAELTSLPVYEQAGWISIVIGLALAVLGVAMLFGFELNVRLPRLDRGGRQRTVTSMFVFGVSYAIASIGCTLPLFLGAVAGTVNRESFLDGVLVFGTYALGMAVILVALTVAIALARTSLVRLVRRALPYVGRVAGGLVALAGLYVAHYGWDSVRGEPGQVPSSRITDVVTGWSSEVTAWIQSAGSVRITVAVAVLLAVLVLVVNWRHGREAGTGPADPAVSTDERPAPVSTRD